jgi:DNA gyrase subunit B
VSQNNENQSPQRQTDEHIRALDPREHVRLRPGMYIGGVDSKAMTTVVGTVLFETLADIRRGICTAIDVTILGPKTIRICDNGQPLSIAQTDQNCSLLEYILTRIAVPGARGRSAFGMGLGLPVVNMLTRSFSIQVEGQGGLWEWRSEKGYSVTDLTRLRDFTADDRWTTSITFVLDEDIFTDHMFDADAIENTLFDYAHILPGLSISYENHMTGDRNTFYAPSGLIDYLKKENRYKQTLHDAIECSVGFGDVLQPRGGQSRESIPYELDMAIQFVSTFTPARRSFVNGSDSGTHGTHIGVCFQALRDSLLGHSNTLNRRDVAHLFDHITLVVSLWHLAPMFESMARLRLLNRDFVQRAYEDLSVALTLFFKEHPETLEALETLALSLRPKKTYLIRKPKAAK